MVIGGFQKVSLSDFPGYISAIIFTRGCGFRCPYCHNPELVDPPRYADEIPVEKIFKHLRSRQRRLQGVVVTGGEPTMHADLPRFLETIRSLGFAIKLDTNGSHPDMLEQVLAARLVDYVAMDIKASPESYSRLAGVPVNTSDIERSLGLLKRAAVPYELRTTYVESLLSETDLKGIARLAAGCTRYVLQPFRATKTLADALRTEPTPSLSRIEEAVAILSAAGVPVEAR